MAPNDSSSVILLSANATTTNHVTSPQHIHGASSSWELSRKYESHKDDNQVTGVLNHGNIHDLPLGQPGSARVVQSSMDSPSIVAPDNDIQSNKPLRKRAMKSKLTEECEDRRCETDQPQMKKARLVVSRSSSEDKNEEIHENDGEDHQDTQGRVETEEGDEASAMSEAELLMASCLLKLSHPKTSSGSSEKKEPAENVQADSQVSSPPAVPSSGPQFMTEDNASVPITPPSLLQPAAQMGPSMSWIPTGSVPHTTAGVPFAVSAAPAPTMASAAIPFMDPATGAYVAVPIMLPSLQQQQRQFIQTQNFHHQQRQLMQQQRLEQLHRATTRMLPHEAAKGGMWMLDSAMSTPTTASPTFSRRLPPSCYSSSSLSAWSGNKPNLVQGSGGSLNSVMMRYNKENKAPSTFSGHTIATPSSVSGLGSSTNPSLWVANKVREEADMFHQMQEYYSASTDEKRKLMWSRQKYLEGKENPTDASVKPIVPEETCSKSNGVGRDKESKRSNNKNPKTAQEEEEIIVDKPHPQDVLSGRGNGVALHDGNRQFRAWVKHYRLEYQQATRSCKGALTRRVIQHVQECGGRFLEQVVVPCSPSSSETSSLDDANEDPSIMQTTWRQLSNARIWEKTSQALREKPNC